MTLPGEQKPLRVVPQEEPERRIKVEPISPSEKPAKEPESPPVEPEPVEPEKVPA